MGTPIFYEVVEHPGTAGVIITCIVVYVYLHAARLGYDDVGLSYDRAVQHGEVWRIFTSQLSHIETLHLLFNVSSLWSLREVEHARWTKASSLEDEASSTTLHYLHTSLVLMVFSGLMCLAIYHVVIYGLNLELYSRVNMVGYSCVIFGWMAVLSLQGSATFSFLGFMNLPMAWAPFLSLVFTSIVVPRASFVGHLSGILVGYCLAGGLFDWLTPVWAMSLGGWIVLLAGLRLLQQGRLATFGFQAVADGDIERGAVIPTIGGVPDR
eukprot:jgi/Botrbrau1/15948/Bobra.0260s0009.1